MAEPRSVDSPLEKNNVHPDARQQGPRLLLGAAAVACLSERKEFKAWRKTHTSTQGGDDVNWLFINKI